MKREIREKIYGIGLVALLAVVAFLIAEIPTIKALSLSPLIVGIVLGMLYANTINSRTPAGWSSGVTFCSKKILRLAIILYGFRLTLHHIYEVGVAAVVVDTVVVVSTIALGILVGRVLKMDRETALLTSTGSAICGAAAVLGAESVLQNKPYKTTVAVSTVVIFGTIAMFLYPALYHWGLPLSDFQWSVYTGSTVHEVAHVVGAGEAMGESVAASAIIVKMIRVIFLAPVLLVYSLYIAYRERRKELQIATANGAESAEPLSKGKISIPWFAIWFIVVIGFNSLNLLPSVVVEGINSFDTFLLTMAMTALGMGTQIRNFKQAGVKPFLLALVLFVWLTVGGFFLVGLL